MTFAAPWTEPHGLGAVLQRWQTAGSVQRCLSLDRTLEPSPGSYAPLPATLHPGLRAALAQRGIERLYAHQARAIAAAEQRRHVVIATPTASGKSLCFHLPVLDALAKDPSATALFLYPTKALSRDQEAKLLELTADAALPLGAVVFDGDTPGDARRVARERSRILLTNPDMLHSGILPHHPKWASFFQGLRYVVLDELHTYRGVFGSHLAHVVARLLRLARFHGASPTLITATATIGNPQEHAAKLLGVTPREVELVAESGAPRSARHLYVYNPPVVNEQLGIRASVLKQTVQLAADLVRARVSTIVFGKTRNAVEVMLKYLREACAGVVPPEALMAYRGGYLPETRRHIERGLRSGEIACVIATNALELGIDIGDLDAVLCAGYPGTVAGTWQRFGRAGRRGADSIAVLVCSSEATDQFLAREPEYLLAAGAEQALIDPSNPEIFIQHLKCAAFELPFVLSAPGARPLAPRPAAGEGYAGADAEVTRDALDYLAQHGLVHASDGRYHWTGEAFPAQHVSLRSVGWDNFVIIDVATERALAELDWRSAHTMLHEQAIYQHDAEQWQVERLDYDNHKAFVRRVQPDYFTTALTYRSVEVIEPLEEERLGPATLGLAEVKVVEKVTGYKKLKYFTHENAGYGDVALPEMQMHTMSCSLTLPSALLDGLGLGKEQALDGLRGLGAALELVSALALMCDPRDLGQTLGDGASPDSPAGRDYLAGKTGGFNATLFLFDAIPNGVGLAERIFRTAPELLQRARRLVSQCHCRAGCPACVGPGLPERKPVALSLATLLLS